MPRTAKPQTRTTTMTGAPAQPIGAVAGQEYGMGVAQMDLQRQLPAPNVQTSPSAAPPQPAATPPQVAPEVSGQPVQPTAMEAAAAMPGGKGLFETPPVSGHVLTAGLSSGPGPGPEIMSMNPTISPLRAQWENMSRLTGDPYFANLARNYGL